MKGILTKAAIAGLGTLMVGGFAFAAVGNDHTGYDSDNDASVEISRRSEVEAHNDADITNVINGMLGTGHNKSSYNTGNGNVRSGNASATVKIANKANDSTISVTSGSIDSSIPSVTNSTTGAESHNDAWVESHNCLEVDVHNDGDVENIITVEDETGGNKSSYNTGSGSAVSGDASLNFELSTTLNSSNMTAK